MLCLHPCGVHFKYFCINLGLNIYFNNSSRWIKKRKLSMKSNWSWYNNRRAWLGWRLRLNLPWLVSWDQFLWCSISSLTTKASIIKYRTCIHNFLPIARRAEMAAVSIEHSLSAFSRPSTSKKIHSSSKNC